MAGMAVPGFSDEEVDAAVEAVAALLDDWGSRPWGGGTLRAAERLVLEALLTIASTREDGATRPAYQGET